MANEYSVDNKYQVFTIPLTNGLQDYEIDTMLISNFLTTFFVDDNGDSINTGKVNISITSSKNYGLTFLNGSKYKAQFQKLYLNAQPQPNTNVRVFTSIDCFYEKETPVTNAVLTQPIDISNVPQNYDIFSNGSDNNGLTTLLISSSLNGRTVKGIKSVLISNLDTAETLYVGNSFGSGNYNTKATPVYAGEKFSLDFNPLAIAPYSILLYSANSCKYQYSVSFTY